MALLTNQLSLRILVAWVSRSVFGPSLSHLAVECSTVQRVGRTEVGGTIFGIIIPNMWTLFDFPRVDWGDSG